MKTTDEFSPSAPARAGSVVSVLVVDDEIAVRRFACRVLEATDGAEVLELIQGQTVILEVVVSDGLRDRGAF
jgi:CheY-like chemotaxis protein